MSAPRRRDQVVILKALNLESKCETRRSIPMRTLLRRLARAVFSPKACAAVCLTCLAVALVHSATAPDALAAQDAMATDIAVMMPWLAAVTFSRKGGMK